MPAPTSRLALNSTHSRSLAGAAKSLPYLLRSFCLRIRAIVRPLIRPIFDKSPRKEPGPGATDFRPSDTAYIFHPPGVFFVHLKKSKVQSTFLKNFLSPNFFFSIFFSHVLGLHGCAITNRTMPRARARLLPAGPCAPNRCFLHKLWEHALPGGINRKGPRSQGPLLGTSSLVCESSDRIGLGTRPGGANRGPPSPIARCNWKSYNNPKGSGPAHSTPGWESSTTAAEAADVGGQVIKEKYPSPIRNFSSLVKRHLHPILL